MATMVGPAMNKSATHFLSVLILVSCATPNPRHDAAPDAPSKPAAPASASTAPQPDARADATPAHGVGDAPPAQDTADAGAQAQMIYTCPMHLEIQQAKPGRCPKCRMPLVLDEARP